MKITMPQMAQLSIGLKKIIGDQPRTAGAKAVSFFKANFSRKGFPNNGRLDKWPERNKPDYRKGGALLIKTGRLRRSIRTAAITNRSVKVATDVPYAEGHNEGANIEMQVAVPAHARKAHAVKAHSRKSGTGTQAVAGSRRKAAQVKGHSRKMNMKIERRQFIGHSTDLMKSIDREYLRQVQELENQIFKK